MRFLFCPLASSGFVFPAIAVALALEERGHEVAFATGLEYGPILEAVGLTRISRGDSDGPSFQAPTWFKPLSVAMQYRHIEYAVRRFEPDALVASVLALGPLFVRELFELPCAVLGFLPYLWPTAADPEQPTTPAEERRRWRHHDMLRYLNEARDLFQLSHVLASPAESPFLGDLFLHRSTPGLTGDLDALPGRVHLVGACAWEPPQVEPELEAWLARARAEAQPVLYAQQGRTFDSPAFWPHLLDALASQPSVRVAASVSRMDVPTGEPPAAWYVRPLVPQGAVMSSAQAVIASGNTTAALGALSHGLPGLFVAGGGEQPDVADLLERAGAALHMRAHELSTARMRQLIDELYRNEGLRARARAIQGELAEIDGPRRAAELVERLAQERGPVLRATS